MIIHLITKSLVSIKDNTAVIFELLRPICLIQKTWRTYRARRREKAAYVISRAVLHFLYRPVHEIAIPHS